MAVGFGGAGGYLEMNVYKPLMIFNITHSITIMTDGCTNFRKFLVEGTKPNLKKIKEYVDRSLMLVTALAPVIGYDKASKIAHYAMDNDLTLKAAALQARLRHRRRVRSHRRSSQDGQAVCRSELTREPRAGRSRSRRRLELGRDARGRARRRFARSDGPGITRRTETTAARAFAGRARREP